MKFIRIVILFMLWVFCFGENCIAQEVFPPLPEERRPHIRAVFTNEKITIDGKANEPAWQTAPVATHFIVSYPKQGAKAAYDTEVRILYDNTNLYIYAKCDFPPGKKEIQVQDMRRDFNFDQNELLEIVIDPFKDPRSPVMGFSVTPYGTQMDIMHYADGTFDYNWDAVWQAASSIQDHSWTTEIAIPFSSLRYPKGATEWSINFIRNIRHIGELNGWSGWPMAFFESRMEYAGIVTNIIPPKEKLNLQFDPYTLVNTTSTNKSPASYKPTAGGEIKYAINTNTMLEGTVNTDFAQADADVEVINLSRSTVFFPEKRQFFLENASLFSIGQNSIIQPFFSRQIGLSPAGLPLTIDGGIRFIQQDTKQATGILIMKQEGDSTENGALFGVFRYKRNVSEKLEIGGMAVLKENLAGSGQPAYLNPVGVADALWRAGPSLFIRGMGSISANTLTKQKGTAAFSEVNYSNNTFAFDWFETEVSKGYQAQTGYVQRDNFINTQPSLSLNLHKDWFPTGVAFYNPQLTANIYEQESTGNFQEADVNLIPFQLIFTDLGQFNFNITSSWQALPAVFNPVRNVNIAAGNYQYNRYELYGTTNQAAHYSIETRLSTGGYYNGSMNSYYISLRAEPVTRFTLVMSYTANGFKNTGISRMKTTTELFAPELRAAVTPKILLSAFYQYDSDARNGSLNARFSWEYKPLSFVYLVFNSLNNYYKTPFDIPQKQQNSILKLTYIYQLR
jgi:hypothetical protein